MIARATRTESPERVSRVYPPTATIPNTAADIPAIHTPIARFADVSTAVTKAIPFVGRAKAFLNAAGVRRIAQSCITVLDCRCSARVTETILRQGGVTITCGKAIRTREVAQTSCPVSKVMVAGRIASYNASQRNGYIFVYTPWPTQGVYPLGNTTGFKKNGAESWVGWFSYRIWGISGADLVTRSVGGQSEDPCPSL